MDWLHWNYVILTTSITKKFPVNVISTLVITIAEVILKIICFVVNVNKFYTNIFSSQRNVSHFFLLIIRTILQVYLFYF